MRRSPRSLAQAAVLAALYTAINCIQNLLLPGSAGWMVQVRLAEMLCVLAFFTPAAVPGLTIGCLIANLTGSVGLPLDFLAGTLATFLSTWGMRRLRNCTIFGLPVPGLLLPALINGLLVGWELAVYMGGGFLLNALYVAAGEVIAVGVFGGVLYQSIKKRRLPGRLFGG